jgi:hypothetical protein
MNSLKFVAKKGAFLSGALLRDSALRVGSQTCLQVED